MAILSKSRQLERLLRLGIKQGKWKPDERLPTERELVSRFSVSPRTIREALIVLANDGLISRRQGSGTYVLPSQALAAVTVAAKMEALQSPSGYYYQSLVRELRTIIEQSHFDFRLTVGCGAMEQQFVESLALLEPASLANLQGVICVLDLGRIEAQLTEHGIPSVSIVSEYPTRQHCVVTNYEQMLTCGIRLLHEKGLPDFRLIHLTGPNPIENATHTTWISECMRKAGTPQPQEKMVSVPWTGFENGLQGFRLFKQLWQTSHPQALFLYDDSLIDPVLQAAEEFGVRIPDDLTVVTHANAGRHYRSTKGLIRLEFDIAEIAAAAWRMFNALIEGKPTAPVVTIEPRLRAEIS